MLSVLSHESDLKHKAEVLVMIMEIGPKINSLLQQIQAWSDAKTLIVSNSFLPVAVSLALQVGTLLNDAKQVSGFQMRTLCKLFDVKSTANKEKSVYYVMLKSLLQQKYKHSDLNAWKLMPSHVFESSGVSLLKSLVDPLKLVAGISEMQAVQESLLQTAKDFSTGRSQDGEFAAGIFDYLEFYESQVKS